MSIAPGPVPGGHRPPKAPPPVALGGSSEARRRGAPPTPATGGRPLGRAAQYVRMSTEHQRYSTENQSDAIRQYAEQRGLEVVRTYADEGKSGLRLDGRDALKRLIGDVQNSKADFTTILVYDISRWGRFQDADESAYYEYICRRAGIAVQYCAEQFENDGSPVSTIVKGVKRAMAGEYSRELSAKVFAGQCRLIEIGYRQGGPAGYPVFKICLHAFIVPVSPASSRKSLQRTAWRLGRLAGLLGGFITNPVKYRAPGPDARRQLAELRHVILAAEEDHRVGCISGQLAQIFVSVALSSEFPGGIFLCPRAERNVVIRCQERRVDQAPSRRKYEHLGSAKALYKPAISSVFIQLGSA
jgi:DNA invertase Pin-like site-specific DNA recombinase